ncbi:MAG TPA: thioredoxin family protein [Acetobacteraceae bacterium]|nr:thioredoxin family protein [Acetobacteraceae bacterium]
MRHAKTLSAALLASSLAVAACPVAWAATEAPFTQPAFEAAQRAGKPILVYITASWCPTCAKQRPILSRLENDPALRDLAIYQVDFDTQKDVVRAMGARMQSTLIVFHGATEKGRSTGETDPSAIKALLEKAET